jgi:hypothetical protein
MAFLKSRFTLLATAVLLCGLAFTGFWAGASPTHAASPHFHPNCASNVTLSTLCTEVWDTEQVFGEGQYVGHDEPSTLFYSNQPGSGNQMRYQLTIPKDPPSFPAQALDLVQFRAAPGVLVRYGHVRCAVLSRATEHLHPQ